MDIYKDFIQRLRRKECEEVYFLLAEDVTQKFKEFVSLLIGVPFLDNNYHTFYGEVKTIVSSFVIFFSATIDAVIQEADRYIHVGDRDDMLWLLDRTLAIHEANQDEFNKDFLPATTPLEKQAYQEIQEKHNAFNLRAGELNKKICQLDKQFKVEDFAKEHFKIVLKKTSDMFIFVHTYIGMILADAMDQTRISLEEIRLRMNNNLKKTLKELEINRETSIQQLYEKNKEGLYVARSECRSTIEMAEIDRGIETLRDKIENVGTDLHIARLQEEIEYWTNRINEFNEIADNLKMLKAEQDNVIQSEKTYHDLKCNELPGSKRECWKNISESFAERKEYLNQMIIRESKALISFFAVRGTDRIFYTDNVGPYYVDEFNHQVYVFDFGLAIYHINCEGEFKEFPENAYYFDKYGRYIQEGDKKVYQCAPCTSQYSLGDDHLLKKTTKDCGHSEWLNPSCRMEIVDPTDVEVLPDPDPIDIKRTMDSETVKYLWDSFGGLLPEALYDVGTERPKNPIHFLAHRLIYHKYRRTKDEVSQKKKEAGQYRADIFKERKDQTVAANKKWKSKQVKRQMPDGYEDAEVRAYFDAHIAEQMFINSLNFFN